MPIEIRDSDGGLGHIITCRGIIDDEEFVDVFTKHLTQDEQKFKQYRYNLTDFTQTSNVDISNKSLELIASYCNRASTINPEAIVAFVVDQELIYRLTMIYQALTCNVNWEQMVFTTRTEAEAWIKQRVKEKYGIENITLE